MPPGGIDDDDHGPMISVRQKPQAAPRRLPVGRLARTVATAVVVGLGIAALVFAVTDWHMRDAGAYWQAAMRLRTGEPLFPTGVDPEASDVFRYSPWFAWAAIPFTFLPVAVAGAIWSLILVAASCIAVVPLVRQRAWVQLALFWPILIAISAIGNVHPLLVAALVHGVERRSGPLWIAAAASLKAFPVLFVLTYLGRRQWRRGALTLALTALLVAPFLLYDLSAYVTEAGAAALLFAWPGLYVAVVGIAAGVSVWSAGARWGWLASATAVTLALPRFFVYDVTYLLVGTAGTRPDDRSSNGSPAMPTAR